MGVGIFLWVERRLPSGSWTVVPRSDERIPEWQREDASEVAEEREAAKAMRLTLRDRSIPTRPQMIAYLKRAAEHGFGGPKHCWYLGKNYNLFAIIAGHCNKRIDGRFTEHIISPPRGLPLDISDDVLEDATRGSFDEAMRPSREQRLNAIRQDDIVAASWVTVEELLAVDWDVATHGGGVVGEEGDFLIMLREEIVPIGPADAVRLVFFFDS
jgi:hypothetical protein